MGGSNSRKLEYVAPSGKKLVQTASFQVLWMRKRTYSVPLKLKTGASGHAVTDEVLQNLAASGAYGV